MLTPASVGDYRLLARRRLPKMLFDYLDGGAFSEQTMKANATDLQRLHFRQRVLRDVSHCDISTRLLGEAVSMPVVLAPVGFAGMMARRGEVQAARAAAGAGVPFCLSTVSVCSMEELAAAGVGSFWFQLYVLRDRDYSAELLRRAAEAGCKTLVFTVDLPRLGVRYRDIRNGMSGQLSPWGRMRKMGNMLAHPRWLLDVAIQGKPLTFGNLEAALPSGRRPEDFKDWVDAQFDPTMTWQDLAWIREHWPGRLIIKGIMDPDDALAAADAGADAIVVSNHGGRQLDGAPSSILTLPAIVKAVSGSMDILVDGGFRSGQDLIRALALGADGCMLGRAWVYALAAGGERAVAAMLASVKQEAELTMALLGKTSITELGPEDLV